MRIQTRGNSTTVWLCSDIGVIDGTMTMSAPTLEKILQAVNEKYGTSFEGWSQLPTAYEVGDTVPNWNAYEKIEMPVANILFKLKHADGQYFFMQLIDGILTVSGQGLNVYVYDDTTGYQSASGVPKNTFLNELGDKLQYSSIVVRNLEDNYQIPNFENYVEI